MDVHKITSKEVELCPTVILGLIKVCLIKFNNFLVIYTVYCSKIK